METSERRRQMQRLAVAERVLQGIRRKDFRSDTPANPRGGERIILPALPDDRMGMLFDQLRAVDGLLHVVVPDGAGLSVFSMAPHRRAKHATDSATTEADRCPISPDTQVVMVLRYLQVSDGPIVCYEASPNVTIELVDTVGIPS